MSPAVVVDQQAKLGVSAEESKVQRLKRQQQRFRDRGGAFIPSSSNPLINILLARTVSGESPSKAPPKNVTAKRPPPYKAHQTLAASRVRAIVVSDKDQAFAEGANSKPPASKKGRRKVPERQRGTTKKSSLERRDRPTKGRNNASNFGKEKPLSNTKSKSASKGQHVQKGTTTMSPCFDASVKPKVKARAKSNLARAVIEVLVSDDDQPLFEVCPKTESSAVRNKDNDETDQIVEPVLQASSSKVATRTKAGKIVKGSSGNMMGEEEMTVQNRKSLQPNATKRLRLPDDNDNEDTITSVIEQGKALSVMATCVRKGKGKAEPDRGTSKPTEVDGERPRTRTSKPQKRKEEDSHDDRPRKVVKFSGTSPHSSSQILKENKPNRTFKSTANSVVKQVEDLDEPRRKMTASRAKRLKGPPRKVLKRIEASAGRHMRCADSESDELDCLS